MFPVLKDTSGPNGSRVKRGDKRSEVTTFFARHVKKAAIAAGLRPDQIDFHGLRKTCSTLQYEFGADERTADDFLGHSQASKPGISDLYIFASKKRQRAAVEAVKLDVEGLKLPGNLPQIATEAVADSHNDCGAEKKAPETQMVSEA